MTFPAGGLRRLELLAFYPLPRSPQVTRAFSLIDYTMRGIAARERGFSDLSSD
jgi:hypothetical protein